MQMRVCTKCGCEKEESDFSWKNKSTSLRSPQCKKCHSDYSKNHYDENLDYYKAKAAVSNPAKVARNKAYIFEYLTKNSCVDCGESDLEVLQFDHKVMVMSGSGGVRVSCLMSSSLARLQEEVAKCDVRCANCHVRQTRKQLGWFRGR